MFRSIVAASLALVVCAGVTLAQQAKKGATVSGTIKKVDAEKGVLTVAVKQKKEIVEKEFKIEEATKFVVVNGDDKKELSSKEGIKNELVKEGGSVAITVDADGKVTQVTVGSKKAK